MSEYTVDGFAFTSSKAAADAQEDLQRIAQLEGKLNYNNLDAVAMVYIKSIQNELFHTVVGGSFLKRLQIYLQQKGYQKIDFEKYPIPAYENEVIGSIVQSDAREQSLKVRTNYQQELKQKLSAARWVIVILIAVVVALFVITLTGENANIINYRYNIQNEYSQWQQQLEEREATIREREKQLQIDE